MNKLKIKSKMRNDKGITLVALVITIIVILILAGVTVGMAFGKNGILGRASQAKQSQEIAELQDIIQLEAISYNAGKLDPNQKDPVTVKGTFAENLRKQGVIDSVDDVEAIPNDEGKYYVHTSKGYLFTVALEDNLDVYYEGQEGNLNLRMALDGRTTNTVSVRVYNGDNATDWVYKYRKLPDGTFNEGVKKTEEPLNKFTYTGLAEGTYEFKAVAKRNGKNLESNVLKVDLTTSSTGGIPEPAEGAITIMPTYWDSGSHTASVEFKTETGLDIEYRVDGNGQWTKGTRATNLINGQVVHARLTDGVNASKTEVTVTIQDNIAPTVNLSSGIVTENTIQVTGSASDGQSGIANEQLAYYIKEHSTSSTAYEKKGDSSTGFTFENLKANTAYDVKAVAVDKAGNTGSKEITNILTLEKKKPTINGDITASNPIWNNETASIELNTSTNYNIEYQIGNTLEGSWTPGKNVSGIANGQKVYARLYDNEGNRGKYVEFEIKDTIPPVVNASVTNRTTSSISVSATAQDNESGISNLQFTYYIKKSTESNYQNKGTAGTSYTFTGLQANVGYDIKVEIKDNAGNVGYKVINNQSSNVMPDPTVEGSGTITISPAQWMGGKATITLDTNTKLTIQYQKDISTGNWTTGSTVSDLSLNQTVFARLWDGTNGSKPTSVKILDGEPPTVTLNVGTTTTNSIPVNVSAKDNEAGMPQTIQYKYYIKKRSEAPNAYVERTTTTDTSYTFTGLDSNIEYDVKVTTQDLAGNVGAKEQTGITTKGIPNPNTDTNALTASSPSWSGGQASTTLSTNSGLQIEWQINSTSGSWKQGNKVTGLSHNSTVNARLSDGKNKSDIKSFTIRDTINPNQAEIKITNTTVEEGQNISATVTLSDDESGINIGASKYELNTSSGSISEGTFTNSFTNNPQTLNIKAQGTGTYYLHVLSVDNAGNKSQQTSSAIKVKEGEPVKPTEWAEINELSKAIQNDGNVNNGTYTVTENVNGKKYTLSVGDIIPMNYNGRSLRTRVLGFMHDNLTSGGRAGISFEFVDCMIQKEMNTSGSSAGGWAQMPLRHWLDGEISKLEASSYIKSVNKWYITDGPKGTTDTCEDRLWLLSASEVLKTGYTGGNSSHGWAQTGSGRLYRYYERCCRTLGYDVCGKD